MTVLAVLDSSPLIILHQIGRLELLRSLFQTVVVPPAVAFETAPSLRVLPSWVEERQPASVPRLVLGLGAGEREAIALALELSADVIVLDELAGRRRAARLGLSVTGSAGLLVQARRRALIEAVRPELDAMIANGFFVSRQLYRQVLETAGETEP